MNCRGQFTITVEDDIPEEDTDASGISGFVEEDGMDGSGTGDLSVGNKTAGNDASGNPIDTNADDEDSGSGATSVATLFSDGADEDLTYGLSEDTSDMDELFSCCTRIGVMFNREIIGFMDRGDATIKESEN